MTVFKLGDRIVTKRAHSTYSNKIEKGAKGTICGIDGGSIGIRFDDHFGGHDLHRCREDFPSVTFGHGWILSSSAIELEKKTKPKVKRERKRKMTHLMDTFL